MELGLKFLRQGAGELHGFSGAGVDEPQARGVEALALKAGSGLPIDRVPQDGAAQISQVDPDLVGPPGLQTAAEVGEAGKAGQDLSLIHI